MVELDPDADGRETRGYLAAEGLDAGFLAQADQARRGQDGHVAGP